MGSDTYKHIVCETAVEYPPVVACKARGEGERFRGFGFVLNQSCARRGF